MAGNRQQSRFLAMVGNYERLAELSEEAADSEDAALIQTLKTMDSIETKLNQLKVTFQEFYTSTGIEDLIKGILDFVTKIINTMNSMPKLFGKIPIAALGVVAQLVASIKTLSNKFLTVIDQLAERISKAIYKGFKEGAEKGGAATQQELNNIPSNSFGGEANKDSLAKQVPKWANIASTAASLLGTATSSLGIMMADGSNKIAGSMEIAGSILNGVGTGLSTGFAIGGPWGAAIGTIVGIISALPGFISGAAETIETAEERVDKLGKKIKETEEDTLLSKNELKTLENYRQKYEELYDARNDSNEAYQEWLDLNNEIAATYPSLISSIDAEGNYIVSLGEAYEKLIKEKKANYLIDLKNQGAARIAGANDIHYTAPSKGKQHRADWLSVQQRAADTYSRNISSEDVQNWTKSRLDDDKSNDYSLFSEVFNYGEDNFWYTGPTYQKDFTKTGGKGYTSKFIDSFVEPSSSTAFETLSDAEQQTQAIVTLAEELYFTAGETEYNLELSFEKAIREILNLGEDIEIDTSWLSEYGFTADFLSLLHHSGNAKKTADLQVQEYINAAIDFDNSLQAAIFGAEKVQGWNKFLETKLASTNGNKSDFEKRLEDGEKVSDIYSSYYSEYISSLGNLGDVELPSVDEDVADFYENLGSYSQRAIEEYLGELGINLEDPDSKIGTEFNKKLEEEVQPRIDRFMSGMAALIGTEVIKDGEPNWEPLQAMINNLPVELLDEVLAQYKKLGDYGHDAKLFEKYNEIWLEVEKNTDSDEAQKVASLIAKADLTTLTGILTLVESVEDLDENTANQIKELTNVINVNLQTDWRLFSEKLTASLESLGEALNKASSGMNLEEAKKMAEKLGISITEFELVDGQFFYHNLEALENAYLEQYATLRQQLKSETQSQIDSLGELSKVDETSSINESWSEENQTLFNTYFEDWKKAKKTGEFQDTFYKYVVQQLRQMEQENLAVTDEYLRQQVAQITRERLEQIYDTISNGISGSMSESEFSQLDYYLKENGYNFTLQTYETTEGLKLTESSVLRVYEVLKQTDSLAAQVVLDELTESAMEAEEKFNNIYEVLEHITELNKEIATTKDSEREAALRRELALAENIRDTLMEAGDAFNFMNQDLPTGYTNPLSAWEGMGDAWKVLDGDDFKAGYIDYTDLYSMINMMESAGVDLEKAGLSFNGKALTASELMQAAGRALVNVDGETFVDLSKIGLDFKLNTEKMKGGLMDGIKLIAESQIDLLDAEILFLETIVKTQKAFEALEGKDGIIDFSDINFLGTEESSWTKEQIESTKWIERLFSNILITSELTIQNIINNPNSWQNLSLESQKFIALLYETVNQIFSSEDWSSDTNKNAEILEQKMNAALAPYGYKFQIDSSFLTQNLSFNTGNLETEIEKKLEELGITNLNDELIQKIAQEIGKQIENGETITLMDIIQLLPEDQQVISLFGLGQAISIQNPEEIIVVEELQMAKVLKWGENSYQALYGEKSIGTYKTEEEAREALTYHSETNNKLLNGETVVETKVELEETGIFEVSLSSGEPTYEYNGFYYPSYEAANSARLEDLENKKLIEGTSTSGEMTEVETSTKVILKTDNITIGTENESGKAEIEIGEVIAHSSGIEISAKDGNVTFTANGKEIEGPQFMAELGIVNLDNLNSLIAAVEKLEVPAELAGDLETIASNLKTLGESLNDQQVARIGQLASNLSKIQTSTKTLSVELKVSSTGSVEVAKIDGANSAKGNVANLSLAQGNAKAAGTLMGELGPELYVTGGRYYVAGQNGAEFVNLPSDAIVFNHLQTRRLLENGSVNGTGKPVTNECNAVAMATGTTGPAQASASETLNKLKEIRAMWQGLLDASAQDFSKKAGSGGSSGSGEDDKAFMHELERWYNLLRQIAKLEQQITYEQAKRENMQSGYKHVQSLEKELALLKKQQAAHQELSKLQREYYDERRDVLKNTSYGKLIFTYDEDGLMQYIEEDGKGLDILAELEKTDENGKAVRNAEEQVAYLDRVGFDISTLLTNADGSKVKSNDYQTMMQIFWDGVDGWMAELDELYDSYNESMTSVEEAIQAQNEILQEYIDNQLSVEERLMDAIVSREEAEIERLEKELDALDEATNKYLDGLKDSLDREKQMYERNKDSEETAKLQRQLAILKRTGGSASEIQSLQDEISSRLEDSYFQQQEDQIDALEQAANNQIEKLQNQIDIMNESLEYQKANGLLWEEVYEMMNNWSPEQMLQFVEEFLPSYRENSALQNDQDSQEALKEFEIWVGKRENAEALANAWQSYYNSVDQYSDEFKAEHAEGAKNAYNLAYATEGEDAARKAADDYFANQATLLNGSGGSGNEEKEEQPETDTTPVGSGGDSSKKASQTSGEIKRGAKGEDVRAIQKALSSLGYYKGSIDGIFGEATQSAVYAFQKAMGIQADGIVGNKTREKFKLKGYKTGGLVDFTGPAWVDGTKTKPEAFLSAEDTAMLKSKIFDNNKYSLRSVVELFEGIDNSGKNITTNNDQGVVFENVQITIESGTIANDYDARRAGEMALEEMLKISRKATNRIVSRR